MSHQTRRLYRDSATVAIRGKNLDGKICSRRRHRSRPGDWRDKRYSTI